MAEAEGCSVLSIGARCASPRNSLANRAAARSGKSDSSAGGATESAEKNVSRRPAIQSASVAAAVSGRSTTSWRPSITQAKALAAPARSSLTHAEAEL